MSSKSILGVIIGITLVTTIAATPLLWQVDAANTENNMQPKTEPRAPPAVSGAMLVLATNGTIGEDAEGTEEGE
jgi:hypothetical protein